MLYSYGYDIVVAVSTSLLKDVPTPTDQMPFLVVSHTQCPGPTGAPLFPATANREKEQRDLATGRRVGGRGEGRGR